MDQRATINESINSRTGSKKRGLSRASKLANKTRSLTQGKTWTRRDEALAALRGS